MSKGRGPAASSPEALLRMRRQRRQDTKPELLLRSELHAEGLRYRVHHPLPGLRRRADVAFPKARVAVFVDGCFWHRCPQHGTQPGNNGEWWEAKLAGNVERDRDTDRQLAKMGWRVIRVWEHEATNQAAQRIARMVHKQQTD